MVPAVAILIATHGSSEWEELAWSRAFPSTIGQGRDGIWNERVQVYVWHEAGGSIADARNYAASQVRASWLCFLDADDELAPGYVDYMAAAAAAFYHENGPRPLLLAPSIQYVSADGEESRPELPNRHQPMDKLNHCVIGTLVPRELFLDVGGFRDLPAYEDWELFLRCVRAGATVADVPLAVYRAWTRAGGRNSQDRSILEDAYRAIVREHREAMIPA